VREDSDAARIWATGLRRLRSHTNARAVGQRSFGFSRSCHRVSAILKEHASKVRKITHSRRLSKEASPSSCALLSICLKPWVSVRIVRYRRSRSLNERLVDRSPSRSGWTLLLYTALGAQISRPSRQTSHDGPQMPGENSLCAHWAQVSLLHHCWSRVVLIRQTVACFSTIGRVSGPGVCGRHL